VQNPGGGQLDTMVEGRRINGQKMFMQIISGTAGIVIVAMRQLFRGLAAKQPAYSLLQR